MLSISGFAALGTSFLPTLAPMMGITLDTFPAVIRYFTVNQMYGFIGYMACQMFAQKVVATGAYEIYLGNQRIFSAIEQGGVPSVGQIVRMLTARGLEMKQGS